MVQKKLNGQQWSERIMKETGCIVAYEQESVFAKTCGRLATFSARMRDDDELEFSDLVSALVHRRLIENPLSRDETRNAIRIIGIMVG